MACLWSCQNLHTHPMNIPETRPEFQIRRKSGRVRQPAASGRFSPHTLIYICMYAHYAYMYVYICLYLCYRYNMHSYIYIYTYQYIYIYTYQFQIFIFILCIYFVDLRNLSCHNLHTHPMNIPETRPEFENRRKSGRDRLGWGHIRVIYIQSTKRQYKAPKRLYNDIRY